MARPKNTTPTTQKTYVFYQEDIDKLNQDSLDAKNIFRLGILAREQGWSPYRENNEVDDLKNRIRAQSSLLQMYIDKFNLIVQILVEKGFELEPEHVKYKELHKLLEEVEKVD